MYMPQCNAIAMTRAAREGVYAVGQFNLNNLDSIRVFLLSAQELRSPLMLGVSAGVAKRMGGYATIAATVREMVRYFGVTVPVCLHADHSTLEEAMEAARSGFDSVMFDGSQLTIEDNLRSTRMLVDYAHARGISVEAEVGAVAGEEDGRSSRGEVADPEACVRIASLGVDLLAAGFGNVHGVYPPDWQGLDFDTLARIRTAVDPLPLVLHGGSGIPDTMIREAIEQGICKINVNTECRIAFDDATRAFIESGGDRQDRNHVQLMAMQPGLRAVGEVCQSKMRLFGCAGRA